MVESQIDNIYGEWGTLSIEHYVYEVTSYECKICKFRSVTYSKTRRHVSDSHDVREKIEKLAEVLGYEDESRIDRFKRVKGEVGKEDWGDYLIEVKTDRLDESVGYTDPNLDAC